MIEINLVGIATLFAYIIPAVILTGIMVGVGNKWKCMRFLWVSVIVCGYWIFVQFRQYVESMITDKWHPAEVVLMAWGIPILMSITIIIMLGQPIIEKLRYNKPSARPMTEQGYGGE